MTIRKPIRLKRRNRLQDRAQRATYAGRTYHSRKEAEYAATLDGCRMAAHKNQRVVGIEPQSKVELRVNGQLICNYYVDFRVTFADGHVEWHEVKGFETDLWRFKRRLFEALYPERQYVVIR